MRDHDGEPWRGAVVTTLLLLLEAIGVGEFAFVQAYWGEQTLVPCRLNLSVGMLVSLELHLA